MGYGQRAYRVQGNRPDGSAYSKDFFSLQKAERSASRLIKNRTEERDGKVVQIPALTNVRIVRSAPLRWLYPEQEGTP